jgi:dTDP-4-amino-4,6-dideoxygalactose transaminase
VRLAPEAAMGRDELILKLSQRGIGTSVHFIPLHRQPVWRNSCDLSASQFPVAEACYERILSLPLYTRMSDADQDRVIATLRELLA